MSNRFFNREFTNYRDIVQIDKHKIELLFQSVIDMDTNELRNIATMHQLPLGVINENGDTLIHKVISNDTVEKNENNRLNVIKFLVNNNVNPDSPNKDNITPLHLACLKQYPDIIKYLLEIKVNPNFADNLGNTPFHYYLNGQIKPYKPAFINDLIPHTDSYKTEISDLSMATIEKNIWNDISDNSGIKAISKTILKSFVTTDELANVTSVYYKKTNDANSADDLKKYKDVVLPLYNKIQTIITNKWGNFKKINDIDINYTDQTIIKDFKSVKDKCTENIENSINYITTDIGNIFSNPPQDHKNKYDKIYKGGNGLDHDPSNNEFHENNNKLINKDKYQYCVDSADNYINYTTKTFIGGARKLDISHSHMDLQDVSKIFYDESENTKFSLKCLYDQTPLGAELSKEFKNTSKYISSKLYDIPNLDMIYNDISDIDRGIIEYNNKNYDSGGIEIPKIYNLMMNTSLNKKTGSRLQVRIPIEALYYVAGSINYTSDRRLSLTQAMKTTLIHLIYQKTNDNNQRLAYWIYILFSTESFNELHKFVMNIQDIDNINYLDNNNTIASILAKVCYQIFTNPDVIIPDNIKTKLKKITGTVEYINKKEWLVYAMTKVYDSMKQKPIENHVVDTIFIIRKTQSSNAADTINEYLKNLDLIYQDGNNYSPAAYVPHLNVSQQIIDKVIINNDFDNSDEKKLFGDKFEMLYHLENNILPSRRLIYLQCFDIAIADEAKKYLLKKFTESYILGLNFVSCFPSNNLDLFRKNINDNQNNFSNTAIGNRPNKMPFLGFITSNSVSITMFQNSMREDKTNPKNYFRVVDGNNVVQFRPSSNDGFNQIWVDLNKQLHKCFTLLFGQDTKINLIDVIASYKKNNNRNHLTKLVPIIYPILLNLNSINKDIENTCQESCKPFDFKTTIDTFVKEMNSINSNYFINYYLNTKTEDVIIPSFFYYKIPTDKSQEKSIIFDDSYNSLELLDEYDNSTIVNDGNLGDEFNILEDGVKMTDHKNTLKDQNDFGIMSITPFNNSYIQSILNKEKYIKSNTIKKYMKISKKAKLPPSLEFDEFYKMMVLDLIHRDVVSDADISGMIKEKNKLFKIDGTNEELGYKFTKAQITETVISRYFKWQINSTVSKILKKIMNITESSSSIPTHVDNQISYVFADKDFTVSLSDNPSKYPDFSKNENSNDVFLSFYRINERKENKEDDFILYSNDYTSNTLNKIFYKFILEKNIMVNMLKNNAHTYITNNENKTAIYSVLRNYYYPIFTEINNNKQISYDFTNNIKIGTNVEYPTKYILDELTNHSNKLLNDSSYNSNILKSFSFNQYNQIKVLITSDPEFGNNILRNSELSYSVIGYIINQYLFRTVFYDPDNMDSIFSTNNISDPSLNNFPFSNDRRTINMNDFANVLEEVVDDLKKSRTDMQKQISKLKKNKKAANIPKNIKDQFDAKINKLNSNISEIKKQITSIDIQFLKPDTSKKLKESASREYDIINYYDSFIDENNKNRGSYMMLWDAYLKPNKTEKDMNLILLNVTKNISNKVSPLTYQNITKSDIKDINDKGKFYHTCSNYIEDYFKNEKFLESNDILIFVNRLLIHMTQNVICFGFEVSIKKCLFNYFLNKHKGENIDITINRVGEKFNQTMRQDGKNMIEILYEMIAAKLVLNSVKLFGSKKEQLIYSEASTKEILSEYINLFIDDNDINTSSPIYKNLNVIVNYFDKITTKMIYNWQVTIENYFRFVINQSRIVKTLNGLHE